jgi:cell wall-associated NlpC family hydrolase
VALADVVSRINEIEALFQRSVAPAQTASFAPALAAATPTTTAPTTTTTTATSAALPTDATAVPPTTVPTTTAAPVEASSTPGSDSGAGARALAIAEGEVGQTEQPPGSNDSPRLAVYRSATAGAAAGQPWCAYFVSWAAAQAGAPIGEDGSGLGSVAQIRDWAQRTGRLMPASSTPAPGDLILFGNEHVGIVESVNPDGSLTTVEGNYGNAVTRVHRSRSEATDYVHL